MLAHDKLPNWFVYPREFLRVVSLDLKNPEPWIILEGKLLEDRMIGMNKRFRDVDLVPFARREDNDDVACWAKSGGNTKVFIVHDFSTEGWLRRTQYNSFWEWFADAIVSMIEHESY